MKKKQSTVVEPIAAMNVIPFIDICLVLLIIVLVTASFSTPLVGMTQPQAEPGAKTEYREMKDAVVIDVLADGKCSIDGVGAEAAELTAQVSKHLDKPMVVRAKNDVKSKFIIMATTYIKAAGTVRLTYLPQD